MNESQKSNLSPENLASSSFAAMAGVLLSRASGVIRTIIVNASFGAATALDAFNAAFRFPNALRDLFADGALSAAFMTALVETKAKGHPAEKKLISIVVGFFGVVTLLLATIGAIFARDFILLITDERFKSSGGLPIAVVLFRILAFYLPITMLNAVIMAILGILGKSFRAMNGSIFLSIGMIAGALVFTPLANKLGFIGIIGLALGAMIGAIMQMLYQLRPILALGLFPLPNLNPLEWLRSKSLHKILYQMGPRALGQGALTIALAVNTYFATQIGAGILTYIVTAVIIIQVPIGLFGVATGFAALPILSATLNDSKTTEFPRLLMGSLQTTLWLSCLTSLAISLLIVPFYIVLFQHGKIGFHDTIYNSITICSYAIGILFASGSKVLVNTLYALNATRQIVYNAIIYLIVNASLSFWLAPKLGVIGLGLSFGCATAGDFWLNYYFIGRIFQRKYQQSLFSKTDFFTVQLVIFTFLSFVTGLLGVFLTQYFWARFELLFGISLNFWTALIILCCVGLLLVLLDILILLKLGPSHLRSFLIHLYQRLQHKKSPQIS